MNILVGPYYVSRDGPRHFTVRHGRNGIVADDATTKRAAAAICRRLNNGAAT